MGPWHSNSQASGGSYSGFDTIEILDAYSGHLLNSYHLNAESGETGLISIWEPDSQHLLLTIESGNSSSTSSSSNQTLQVKTWDFSTNHLASVVSASSLGLNWPTADGRYMILGSPDGRTMKIWQTSNSHPIATIKTPGIPARTDAFSALGNQYLVIGQRENFYIWSIATGKLL